MTQRQEIGGILLAAGAASRFGSAKLLHTPAGGVPIGIASWQRLHDALPRSVVVVRAGDADVQRLFSRVGAHVVECEDAALGMGHSLACGVSAMPEAAGWVIALADMPGISSETIRTIAAELLCGASIVVPTYRGERGHPVGFRSHHRNALLALSGDQGARSLVQRHADDVLRLSVDDIGVLQDIDTREDAERLTGTLRTASY